MRDYSWKKNSYPRNTYVRDIGNVMLLVLYESKNREN